MISNEVKGDVEEVMEKALGLFADAVEFSNDLEILGTARTEEELEVLVIRDGSKEEGVDGAYVEVSIDEIVRKVTNMDEAIEIVRVIQNDRASVVLLGITRIVGYYSRVNNWNKSKVGELRDRAKGSYGLTSEKPLFQESRLEAINSL